MDALILQVPEVAADDISARFKATSLTTIEGELTYSEMDEIRDKLNHNAMAIKSKLRGGLYGHLGMVMKYLLYEMEARTAWTVPTSSGAYPVLPNDANENDKNASLQT